MLTATGLRPIADVQVGDLVLSYDEESAATVYEPVTALIQGEKDYDLVLITLATGTQIVATEGHPIYVDGKGWVDAGKLVVGDDAGHGRRASSSRSWPWRRSRARPGFTTSRWRRRIPTMSH